MPQQVASSMAPTVNDHVGASLVLLLVGFATALWVLSWIFGKR